VSSGRTSAQRTAPLQQAATAPPTRPASNVGGDTPSPSRTRRWDCYQAERPTLTGRPLCAVDLAGGLSKPAPALARMGRLHRAIRARAARATHRRVAPTSTQRRVTGEALEAAEARYRAGETLRAIATDVGLS